MAGFVDSIKNAWNYTIGGGYADDIVNSGIFPYKRFEELAAMPTAKMSDENKAEYEKLSKQVSKSAEGFGGTLGVVTERAFESGADVVGEVASGATRGLESAVSENTKMGKAFSWISDNWQLILAGVLGVVGMFSGGFMGMIAKTAAVALAGNSVVEKFSGKNLFEMGSSLLDKFKGGDDAPQKSVVKEKVVSLELEPKNIDMSEAMEKLAASSGINYTKGHAAKHSPAQSNGFVDGLVKGAKEMGAPTKGIA